MTACVRRSGDERPAAGRGLPARSRGKQAALRHAPDVLSFRFCKLFPENHVQERTAKDEFTVIIDETQLPELIHEVIHARASGANHFRQQLLRNLRYVRFEAVLLTVTRQPEKSAGETLFRGIE
jgi:hypothetical protein